MHVGVLVFVTERTIPVTEIAAACEARGIESLWLPEHPVVPVGTHTPYPLSDDGQLPRPYQELPDPFALLAAASAATTRLRLGTGVCLVPERHPLFTAHQVATLDWLSGGRVLFGIGAGWLREEMDLFTDAFDRRFGVMKDYVIAMKRLWTGETVSYDGKHVSFPPVICRPRPVQQPHPPVILGGMGPGVKKRVATYGDGWMPIATAPADLAAARTEIATMAREHGRDPAAITYTVMTGAPPGLEVPVLELLPGPDVYAGYADAGADRVVISLPTVGRDDLLRHLDAVATAGIG
jgi:probable F420-dependent oxidoreductase